MEFPEVLTLENLHHAYLLESERDEGLRAVRELMGGLGISTKGNPDYYEYVFDVFLLEHAHLLRVRQSFHGADGARKIFLVSFNSILSEAQNALLKTLEEPTAGTHFFFITKTRAQLLPTVLSRMQVIGNQSPVDGHQLTEDKGERFLAAGVGERMKMIAPMTKAKADDKSEAKEEAREFLSSLERALYQRIQTPETQIPRSGLENLDLRPDLGIVSALKNIVVAKQALSARSPSVKLLLEHLALTVPTLENKP